MKKILSLLIVFALMLSTTASITNATGAPTGGEQLKKYGFINGYEDGSLREDQKLSRAQLAVLLAQLYGESEKAAAMTAAPGYADDATIPEWAKPYITYVKEKELMVGKTGNRFDASGDVNAQQMATVLLRALGYQVVYDRAIQDLGNLGISSYPNKGLKRGQAFDTMWAVLSGVKPVGKENVLGAELGKLPKKEQPVINDFVVQSVRATGLKTIVISLNKVPTFTTGITVKQGQKSLVQSMSIQDNNVVVVLKQVTQSTAVSVEVKGLKTEDGLLVKPYQRDLVLQDTVVPQVFPSVTALNPKQIQVAFSEPVQFAYSYYRTLKQATIDGNNVIGKVQFNNVDHTAVITLSKALSEGSHRLVLKDIRDYAGMSVQEFVMSFSVAKDVTPPLVEKATVESNKIYLQFSEPLATLGTYRVDGKVVKAEFGKSDDQVILTGFTLGTSALVEVKIEYRGQQDMMKNSINEFLVFRAKAIDDTSLPTAVLTVDKDNQLILDFSKDMQVTGNLDLINKEGDVVSKKVEESMFETPRRLRVVFSQLAGKDQASYTLRLAGLKDTTIRANQVVENRLDFMTKDNKNPMVESRYKLTKGRNGEIDTATIYFSEPMDEATITNLSNYSIADGGAYTSLSIIYGKSVKVEASYDGMQAIIQYEELSKMNAPTFKVSAVKDLAGNMINPAVSDTIYKKSKNYMTVVGTPYVTRKDGENFLVIRFSEKVKEFDTGHIALFITGDEPADLTSCKIEDQTVTVGLGSISGNLSEARLTFYGASMIQSAYNNSLTLAGGYEMEDGYHYNVDDKMAPTFDRIKRVDDTTYELTFSETLAGQKTDVIAALKQALIVYANEKSVIVGLSDSTVITENQKMYSLEIKGTDLNKIKNELGAGVHDLRFAFPISNDGLKDSDDNRLQSDDGLASDILIKE